MSNGSWNGIPLKGEPNTGRIMAPENAPHYYDSNGDLKVEYVVADSRGVLPPDPPPLNQAEGYRRGSPRVLPWLEPHASYHDDGTVATDGYLPDGSYVKAEPEKVLTDAEKAAKAFHDALANPSSLVSPSSAQLSTIQVALRAALTMPPQPGAWANFLAAVKAAMV